MTQEVIDRVKQRLIDGSMTQDQARKVLQSLNKAPVNELQQNQPEEQESQSLKMAGEFAAGFNRSMLGLADFLTVDQFNAISEIAGSDFRIPSLAETFVPEAGAIAGGGLGSQIAGTAGEFASAGLTAGAALRSMASQLPAFSAGEGVGTGILRQLGQTAPAQEAVASVASGAGAETGEEIGGETGKVIGAIAAPVAAIGGISGINRLSGALRNKFANTPELIDSKTGLPAPAFEKALARRGLDVGSLADDVGNLPKTLKDQSPEEIVNQILVRKIKGGAKDNALATIRLEQGRIVNDDLGVEAVRQGFKEGDVAAVKAANQPTKAEMKRILDMTRQILGNTSQKHKFRPTDVAGDHIVARFNFIRNRANELRSELNQIAKKTNTIDPTKLQGPNSVRGLKDLDINTSSIQDNVFSKLDDIGVSVSGFPPKPNFTGSDISKDRTSQRIVKDVLDLLAEPGKPDALRAHKLKRQLDNLIDFNKKSASGITETGKNFAKSVRASLNDAIREVSPQYARVNDELSNAIGTMNEFQRVLGGSIDVFSPGANKAIGQDLRGLLSNRKSRVALENSINEIDNTVRSLGGDFDVDVRGLVQFANSLDARFGAVADTSLKGQFQEPLREASRGVEGFKQAAVRKAGETIEELRGIDNRHALNAIQRILTRMESR